MTINVVGMSCEHCENAVKSALEELGLKSVRVDLASSTASFDDNDSVSTQSVKKAIADAGYEVN